MEFLGKQFTSCLVSDHPLLKKNPDFINGIQDFYWNPDVINGIMIIKGLFVQECRKEFRKEFIKDFIKAFDS